MKLLRWWRPTLAPPSRLVRIDQRPRLAMAMCWWCARRWLAGRKVPHPGCADELRYAFDLHFERLRGRE